MVVRQVILDFAVAKRDCPGGGWEPVVHRRTLPDGTETVWAVSVWPDPFIVGKNISGFPLGRFDDVMPGTWIAQDLVVIVRPGEKVVAEKSESGEFVTVRLVRIGE